MCAAGLSLSRVEVTGWWEQGAVQLVPVTPGSWADRISSLRVAFRMLRVCFFLNPSAHFRACCRCSSCARGLPGFLLHAPRAPCSCTPSGEGAAVELSAVGAVWCSNAHGCVLTCASVGLIPRLTVEPPSAGGVESGSSQALLVCVWK